MKNGVDFFRKWLVLVITLVTLTGSVFVAFYKVEAQEKAHASTKKKVDEHENRVTILETRFEYIQKGIDKNVKGIEEIQKQMTDGFKEIAEAIKNNGR